MHPTRHALTLVAALLVASWAPKVYAQVKIAVVDLQRAISETEDGRQAQQKLKRIFKQRQRSLDQRTNDLKKMQEDFEKQKNVLSDQAKQRKVEEIQQAMVEAQQVYLEYQRELAQKEAELTKGIVDRMRDILRRMGQSEGYTLIIDRSAGVVWVPSNLDITDDLIQRYNRGEGR